MPCVDEAARLSGGLAEGRPIKTGVGARKIKVLARQIVQFLLAGIAMKVHAKDATSGIMNRRVCNEFSE